MFLVSKKELLLLVHTKSKFLRYSTLHHRLGWPNNVLLSLFNPLPDWSCMRIVQS